MRKAISLSTNRKQEETDYQKCPLDDQEKVCKTSEVTKAAVRKNYIEL